jgi:TolB-like protein
LHILRLSRLPGVFTVDPNSTFNYKVKAVKSKEVGKELGVGLCSTAACVKPTTG